MSNKFYNENESFHELLSLKFHVLISLINGDINEFESIYSKINLLITESPEKLDDKIRSELEKDLLSIEKAKSKLIRKNYFSELNESKIHEFFSEQSEIDKAKSEFVANTSHELRTPLNAIMGYLELIKDGLYDSHEEMIDFVDGAIKSSHHLLKLLNDIINIARVESGRLQVIFKEVDLKHLVDQIKNIYLSQAAQKGIELIFDLPEENISVKGDEEKIRQIFENLLSNALKFSPYASKVVVKIREIISKDHVLCEVIDTGIGISFENRNRIFTKFYQVDGTTTREFGGAGLGLAIAKSFIEYMGGFIGVYSEGKDKGSKFYFTLPVYHDDHEIDLNLESGKDEINIVGDINAPLILIVEDNINYRKYISELLRQNKYSSIGSSTADDGLMMIKEFTPKLVILDFGLPRRSISKLHNGIDLYKYLKYHPQFNRLPIITISGQPLEVIKLFYDNLKIESDNYFEKPIDSKKLINKVNELLSR